MVNESETPGLHEVIFSARELPSGTYFYRLMLTEANGESYQSTKKLILMN